MFTINLIVRIEEQRVKYWEEIDQKELQSLDLWTESKGDFKK